jgi:hypothetical protein
MAPRASRAAADWLCVRRPNASSLKFIAAFAGGVACAGAAIAAWSLPWHELISRSVVLTEIARAWSAVVPQTASPPPSPQQTTVAGCERQTWPYLSQQCLRDDSPPAGAVPGPGRGHVRVVTPDGRSAAAPAAARAAETLSTRPERAAGAAVGAGGPNVDPSATTPVTTPPAASAVSASAQNSPAAEQDSERAQSADARLTVAKESRRTEQTKAEQKKAKHARKRREHMEAANRRHHPRPYELAQAAEAERNSEQALQSNPAEARARHGDVVVTKTYDLADGRRVIETRRYRRGTVPGDVRQPEQPSNRGLFPRFGFGVSRPVLYEE